MKKTISFLLATVVSLACVTDALAATWSYPTTAPASPFAGGSGTESSPYIISTAQQLANMSYLINTQASQYSTKYYRLSADIVLNADVSNSTGRVSWEPCRMDGVFDGANHTISGIYYYSTRDEEENMLRGGLFLSNTGTIQNLGITSSTIRSYGKCAGIAAGNSGTISHCYTDATISSDKDYAAGICATNSGTVEYCYNAGSVAGGSEDRDSYIYAGGIVCSNSGDIRHCYNTGNVYYWESQSDSGNGSDYSTGLICGIAENGAKIFDCYALYQVSSRVEVPLIGWDKATNMAGTVTTISDCGIKEEAKFKSGEVCYLLNATIQDHPQFHQTIGTNNYPVLWGSEDVVYLNDGTFSNEEPAAESDDFVDLGLTSGRLWAKVNIGATSPEDFGDKYAWGELVTKSSYTTANYTYSDNPTTLPAERDVATQKLGSDWRMPTYAEIKELCNQCTWTWTTVNGTKGYLVEGKNGNSIFMPAAGDFDGTRFNDKNIYGYYWTSSCIDSRYAHALNFNSTGTLLNPYHDRYHGRSVRPVYVGSNKPQTTPVSEITLSANSLTLNVGEASTLTATILPENATDKSVAWTSSNETVATINAEGQISALAAGEAIVTCAAADGSGVKATCTINVNPALITNIQISGPQSLYVGKTATYTSTLSPSGLSAVVIWTSDNTAVASIDSNTGVVSAKSPGLCHIIATTDDEGRMSASLELTVTYENKAPNGVEMVDLGLPSGTLWATVNIGATKPEGYGSYFAWGETTQNSSYQWSNYKHCKGSATTLTKYCTLETKGVVDNLTELLPEDDAAATVWGNAWKTPTLTQLVELMNGAYITSEWVTINGIKGRKITSKVNGNTIFMPAGGHKRSTSVYNTGAHGYYLSSTLRKSNPESAEGRALTTDCFYAIEATRCHGLNVRAVSATYAPRITSITLDKTSANLSIEETISIVPIVETNDGSEIGVRWSSSNESAAVVDQNGLVTAVGYGTAIIKCEGTDHSRKSATCEIHIEGEVESINISGQNYVYTGETRMLSLEILPEGVEPEIVSWSSSNPEVATVDQNGVVTGVSVGTTTITATAEGKSASIEMRCLVWESLAEGDDNVDYNNECFTILPWEDGTLTINNAKVTSISWSYDQENWNTFAEANGITIPCTRNVPVYLRSIATAYGKNTIQTDFRFSIRGNIMSLLNDAPTGNDLTGKSFNSFFSGCTKMIGSKYLRLPATKLSNKCYRFMFQRCTALLTVPETTIAISTIDSDCNCEAMFQHCESIKDASKLIIVSSKSTYCSFLEMFCECTSLERTPLLKITSITNSSYSCDRIFKNCSNLKQIKAMWTTTPSVTYCGDAYLGIPSKGIFVKNFNATWTSTGVNACPSGWKVIYYNMSTDKYYLSDKKTECDEWGLNLQRKEMNMFVGHTADLQQQIWAETLAGESIIWSSDNEAVATVDENGVVTALSSGVANITAMGAGGFTTSCKITVHQGAPADVELVDLGLPSGTLWANMNVGAEAPEEYGGYYAWGEVDETYYYDYPTYKWSDDTGTTWTKYGPDSPDQKTELDPCDDAAWVNWGEEWRIPNNENCQELIDNCTTSVETRDGVEGCVFTGPNGNSIFIPKAGYNKRGEILPGSDGIILWSRNAGLEKSSFAFQWNKTGVRDGANRAYGRSIRPVSATQHAIRVASVSLNETAKTLYFDTENTLQLTVTCLPANASDQRIQWTSSNTDVATVDENGMVTATGIGTAIITAMAKDGSSQKATCTIKVEMENYLLADGTPFSNQIETPCQTLQYTRTFSNTQWQAFYVPFTISYSEWADEFEVAYVNGVHQYDTDEDGEVDYTIVDIIKVKKGMIFANTPYLIKAATEGDKVFTLANRTLCPADENSIDCSTTIAHYTFTGTYSGISGNVMQSNQYYALGGGTLMLADGSSDLKPMRWYMSVEAKSPMFSTSAPQRISIRVVGEESETGITYLYDDVPAIEATFDIYGRMAEPDGNGLYIKNGEKVFIKK